MTFEAEHNSPFFRRSLAALESRLGAAAREKLARLCARPVNDAAIEALLAEHVGQAPALDAALAAQGMRQARLWLMLTLIQRDGAGQASLEEVTQAMSRFAELTTGLALHAAALEVGERYGVPLDETGQPQDLLAVGMGKAGGNELNVSSDLDLVFVFRDEGETSGRHEQDKAGASIVRPASKIAASDFMHRVARRTVNLLADVTADGFVFRVDTRLRPNGDSGPLVASMAMLEQYFFSQGREWERFAWLKGRVIADSGLAGEAARRADEAALDAIVRPFVYRRYLDFRAFAAMRDLHARINDEVIKRDLRRGGSFDVKLGRGGIREIEFTAQLFQIVRGGRDQSLRDRRTVPTLRLLAQRGLLPLADATMLEAAYVLLRKVEHALQYRDDAQTHRMPAEPQERATVARMLRMEAHELETALAHCTQGVQRVFDGLLHGNGESGDGPASNGSGSNGNGQGNGHAASAGNERATSPSAVAATPVIEPSDAMKARIEALRNGPRFRNAREDTRSSIDRLLEQAIRLQPGDVGLARLIDLLEAVSGRGGYVALLAQFPQVLARVVRMLAQAKWAADYLIRHPIVLDELLDGQLLETVNLAEWSASLREQLAITLQNDGPDVERQMDIVREAHHAQVFRLLAQDLEGLLTVEKLSDHLSELADRVLAIAIDLVWSQLRTKFRDTPKIAAIAYGRLGGKELGYASDLDLVFIHDDDDDRAPEAYSQLAQRLSGWLSTRTAAGLLFEVDLRLRPNGNAGLLVSTLPSFEEYQRKSAWVWEHQALTRARFAAGDPAIGAQFEQIRRRILARPRELDPLRTEVLVMRQKMLDGHPKKSKLFDLKHDRGGMVDIEFIVQFLVLAHSSRLPELLDNAGNIALLSRAGKAGLIDQGLAARVADAYRRYRKLQHGLRLNDEQYARVPPEDVATERAAVLALWKALLGPVAGMV